MDLLVDVVKRYIDLIKRIIQRNSKATELFTKTGNNMLIVCRCRTRSLEATETSFHRDVTLIGGAHSFC